MPDVFVRVYDTIPDLRVAGDHIAVEAHAYCGTVLIEIRDGDLTREGDGGDDDVSLVELGPDQIEALIKQLTEAKDFIRRNEE